MYIEMTPMPDKWEKNFTTTALVRRLEEVLYTKFPNKVLFLYLFPFSFAAAIFLCRFTILIV